MALELAYFIEELERELQTPGLPQERADLLREHLATLRSQHETHFLIYDPVLLREFVSVFGDFVETTNPAGKLCLCIPCSIFNRVLQCTALMAARWPSPPSMKDPKAMAAYLFLMIGWDLGLCAS